MLTHLKYALLHIHAIINQIKERSSVGVLWKIKKFMKNIWGDANDVKLKAVVENLEAPYRCLVLCYKHKGSWLTIQGTTVTGTVLEATKFRDFFAYVMMLPPLTFKNIQRLLSVLLRASRTQLQPWRTCHCMPQ